MAKLLSRQYRAMLPGECPGIWITSRPDFPTLIISPSRRGYVNIDWRSVGSAQPEHLCLLSESFAEKGIVHMRVHFGTIAVADIVVAEAVVDVHMCVHDMGDFQFVVVDIFVKYSFARARRTCRDLLRLLRVCPGRRLCRC